MPARRRHACDACDAPRPVRHRLCSRCWADLPHNVRLPLVTAWKTGNRTTWRRLRKQARAIVQGPARPLPRAAAPDPQTVYARTARLLGED